LLLFLGIVILLFGSRFLGTPFLKYTYSLPFFIAAIITSLKSKKELKHNDRLLITTSTILTVVILGCVLLALFFVLTWHF
jgi:hypothetical protein